MDLQMDYADLFMAILNKFGTDPKFWPSARMLLDYAIVRLAKIGMSLEKTPLASGKNVVWEELLKKYSERILSERKEMPGETVEMIWPFHPAAAWLCVRGKADIAGAVTAAADKLIAEGHRNYVHLLTLHGSKGRQFKKVFIAGVNASIIPDPKCDLEEERRLLYVGITRAEKELVISYYRNSFGHAEEPSPFLAPVLQSESVIFCPTTDKQVKHEKIKNK